MDAVVGTLVLCSVKDVDRTLKGSETCKAFCFLFKYFASFIIWRREDLTSYNKGASTESIIVYISLQSCSCACGSQLGCVIIVLF